MFEAKTVMVLGKALSKGTVLSANKAVYTMQGATIIQELDALAQKVVFHLEEQGALVTGQLAIDSVSALNVVKNVLERLSA